MHMRPEHSFVTGSTLRLRGHDRSNDADEEMRPENLDSLRSIESYVRSKLAAA